MKRYIVNISVYDKPQFDGEFNFLTLREACSKVRANLDCLCNEADAVKELLTSSKLHYWNDNNDGQASIESKQT